MRRKDFPACGLRTGTPLQLSQAKNLIAFTFESASSDGCRNLFHMKHCCCHPIPSVDTGPKGGAREKNWLCLCLHPWRVLSLLWAVPPSLLPCFFDSSACSGEGRSPPLMPEGKDRCSRSGGEKPFSLSIAARKSGTGFPPVNQTPANVSRETSVQSVSPLFRPLKVCYNTFSEQGTRGTERKTRAVSAPYPRGRRAGCVPRLDSPGFSFPFWFAAAFRRHVPRRKCSLLPGGEEKMRSAQHEKSPLRFVHARLVTPFLHGKGKLFLQEEAAL